MASRFAIVQPTLIISQGREPRMVFLEIVADGGCWPNPGPSYGSYKLYAGGRLIHHMHKKDFLKRSNNYEAEWQAVIHGLRGALRLIGPDAFVTIRTDSQPLIDAVRGKIRPDESRLRVLRNATIESLQQFNGYEVLKARKTFIVKELGH